MNTKELDLSFGKVKIRQLSVLDKLNLRLGQETSLAELGLDENSKKLFRENAGTKEDLDLIATAIAEVNNWNEKKDNPK